MRRRRLLALVLLSVLLASVAGAALARQDPPRAPARGAAPPKGPAPVVGVQLHALWPGASEADVKRELDAVQAAGVRSVRVDLSWSSLETAGRGRYSDWYVAKTDAFLDAARARGLDVLATFWSTPCWASSAPDSLRRGCTGSWWERGVQRYAPRADADFRDATAWVVRRWGDRISALEIWNEPNYEGFLLSRDRAAAYLRIARAGYAGAKSVRPDLPVVAGATGGADRDFLERLYDGGIDSVSDGISIHPYDDFTATGDPLDSFARGVPAVHALMHAHGDRSPLWLTEVGRPSCGQSTSRWCVSEAEQARKLRDALTTLRSWRYVKATYVYNLRDKGTSQTTFEDHMGLLRNDFSPKPSYGVLRDRAR